ncbi:class I SAM-dependent methyltransferase [Candidatus Methanoperedens nitratireducens]|uniref:Methyltransferase type 11 domain-containing protein n=1 Tax=Candidatus Methanoperedens nitratireducens TaxID=1392998 RepID=A0A284VPE8_9EURY|nr:class I SAM-dependent methyltransferase [Candidatus Methanoperedens nitroreducens]SNQ61099.1 hypothetical protein MNV_230020 [Candidatus Methanoperedens nitroreducens]
MTKNELNKYEEIARQFPQSNLLEGYHHFRRLELTLYFLKKLGGDLLVLDAACGDGIQAERIIDIHRVIGIDLSPTRIKRAKNRVKEGTFMNGNLYNLPFKSNKFDAVVLGEIIEHLHEPKEVLKEINRILRRNGYLIMDIPSRSNIVDMILRFLGKNPMWGLYVDKSHVAFYDMHSIESIFKDSGFKIIDARGGPCIRYDLPLLGMFTWQKKKWAILKIIDMILERIPVIKKYGAIQIFLFRVVK